MVGEFKDDRAQSLSGGINIGCAMGATTGLYQSSSMFSGGSGGGTGSYWTNLSWSNAIIRNGPTTRTKQKGVKYIIKVL